MQYHIEKNSVQETLIIPLFGRLICSEHYPELFSDPSAKRICAVLDRTKTLGYGDDECNFHLMSRARAEELGFVPDPDAK